MDPMLVLSAATGATAVALWWSNRRVAAPTPEPQPEVWIRRTTTVEEFRATGPAVHTAAHVFDPQYATRLPMLEGPR